jgi:hypothetical protein
MPRRETRHEPLKSTFYWVGTYDWWIPGTYLSYLVSCTLPGLLGFRSAPGRPSAQPNAKACFCRGAYLSRSARFLTRSVRNSRCQCVVAVNEERKEKYPPKEIHNSAHIEGRDGRGLVQLQNSNLCVAVDNGCIDAYSKVRETINEAHPWGSRLKYWSAKSLHKR